MLPSGICETREYEVLPDRVPPRAGRSALASADQRWERDFQAVMARCRKGNVLVLTHEARRIALRLCDWDRPVHFLGIRLLICTYAGGVRETR